MKLYYAETLNPRKACAVVKYLNAPVEYVTSTSARGRAGRPNFSPVPVV